MRSQCRGRGFNSLPLHWKSLVRKPCEQGFFAWFRGVFVIRLARRSSIVISRCDDRKRPRMALKAGRYCNRCCNQIGTPIRCPFGSGGLCSLIFFSVRVRAERQRWQGIQRPLHVQQLRVGVGRHGQRDVGVTHRRLSGSRSNAPLAQQCSERMAQSVNVNRPTAFVALRDASRNQISVEDTDQAGRNGE